MTNAKLQVDGMSCGHCVKSVEGAISDLGASAKVSLENHSVTVDYDEVKVSIQAIIEAIEDQGYTVV